MTQTLFPPSIIASFLENYHGLILEGLEKGFSDKDPILNGFDSHLALTKSHPELKRSVRSRASKGIRVIHDLGNAIKKPNDPTFARKASDTFLSFLKTTQRIHELKPQLDLPEEYMQATQELLSLGQEFSAEEKVEEKKKEPNLSSNASPSLVFRIGRFFEEMHNVQKNENGSVTIYDPILNARGVETFGMRYPNAAGAISARSSLMRRIEKAVEKKDQDALESLTQQFLLNTLTLVDLGLRQYFRPHYIERTQRMLDSFPEPLIPLRRTRRMSAPLHPTN